MILLGRYKHYKGGEYEVIAVGLQEATHEPMVVYRSLQDGGDFPAGTIWIRPESEFVEKFEQIAL